MYHSFLNLYIVVEFSFILAQNKLSILKRPFLNTFQTFDYHITATPKLFSKSWLELNYFYYSFIFTFLAKNIRVVILIVKMFCYMMTIVNIIEVFIVS